MTKIFSLIDDETLNTPIDQHSQIGRTHYRSKLYTSKIGVNPLVTAAHPLFSILERINLSEKPPELSSLQENLSHELQAFMTKVSTSEHAEETILAARYLLCATIDEVIDKAYRDHAEEPEDILPALEVHEDSVTEVPNEKISPDTQFFLILDKAMSKPDFYLDLIELTYFCIITGFEGKYHSAPNGKQALENLLDSLYQLIIAQKPPSPEKLFVQSAGTRRFTSVKSFPWKWFVSILVGVIATGYLIASYQLNQKAVHVLESSEKARQKTY
jgi:type VI secretion system protein ImpK